MGFFQAGAGPHAHSCPYDLTPPQPACPGSSRTTTKSTGPISPFLQVAHPPPVTVFATQQREGVIHNRRTSTRKRRPRQCLLLLFLVLVLFTFFFLLRRQRGCLPTSRRCASSWGPSGRGAVTGCQGQGTSHTARRLNQWAPVCGALGARIAPEKINRCRLHKHHVSIGEERFSRFCHSLVSDHPRLPPGKPLPSDPITWYTHFPFVCVPSTISPKIESYQESP